MTSRDVSTTESGVLSALGLLSTSCHERAKLDVSLSRKADNRRTSAVAKENSISYTTTLTFTSRTYFVPVSVKSPILVLQVFRNRNTTKIL